MVDQSLLTVDHSRLKKAWENRTLALAVASAVGVGKFPTGKHFNPQNGAAENRCKRAWIKPGQIGRTMGEIAVYFKQSPATKGPTCRILNGQSCLEHRIFKGFLHHGT
jgi:hypothetical protein